MVTVREVNAAATRALTLAGSGEGRGWIERLLQMMQEVMIERDIARHKIETLEIKIGILEAAKIIVV